MSIKGTTRELYIGKEEINIITFMGNKIKIPYVDIRRIDYCFASKLKVGYMAFIKFDNQKIQFDFGFAANEPVTRGIDFIQNLNHPIEFKEFYLDENRNGLSLRIIPTFGYKELGLSAIGATLHQRTDKTVYFNSDTINLYRIVDYDWGGPEFHTETTSISKENNNSKTVKKGKALKIGLGAAVGSVFAPGIGTAVGAAMGAGSKGKELTKGSNKVNTNQLERNLEKDTKAVLSLENIETKEIYKLSFICNRDIDSKIKCFRVSDQKETMTKDVTQSLEGLKALKELYDMGAITQEEYDLKKQQLLDF